MSDTPEHNQNVESVEADGANHYYSEQYLELQKEPVLYEWQIDHRQRLAWELPIAIGGFLWFLGLLNLINSDSQKAWQLTLFCIVFGILAVLQGRYLFTPNQLYHYRMTAKGIYYTQQDKIPEVAYTIMRGIGGLLIVGSIIAVGLVGPLALAGAGAGAFLAFKITNMKPEIHHYGCIFKGTGEISIFREIRGIKVWGLPAETGEYGLIFTRPNEYDKVLGDITNALPEYKVIEAATRKEFGY
ncbi:hypothetical protein ACW5WK_18635 [Aeromonas enteropelogenes]|uniref:hypothetical protein n=1 Tax=Aeromonas enteropelogenes TaxID=29489 RepID=UPI0006945309|nr:hypothetical protein [Aeromonas enteropelogenes]UBH56410.1 hypothetical protein LA341_00315 [Aeromonas enteropelogenes]